MRSFNREQVDCGASAHDAEKKGSALSSRVKARWIHDSNDDIRVSAFFVTVFDVSLACVVSLRSLFLFPSNAGARLSSAPTPRLASPRSVAGRRQHEESLRGGGRYNHVARCLSSSSSVFVLGAFCIGCRWHVKAK